VAMTTVSAVNCAHSISINFSELLLCIIKNTRHYYSKSRHVFSALALCHWLQ
jgi:hypothetical protein